MSGVYIPGMEMPGACKDCYFLQELGICDALLGIEKEMRRDVGDYRWKDERAPWCPLVPVPDHGRLIDGDELRASFVESVEECHKWVDEIDNDTVVYERARQAFGAFVEAALRTEAQPTKIEADKEGE